MNLTLIAEGLRLIANGIDAAPEHAPLPAAKAEPKPEPQPQPAAEVVTAAAAAATATAKAGPDPMTFDAFTASLRTVAVKMPPGAFEYVIGPMLAQRGLSGVQALDPSAYPAFLAEAAEKVSAVLGSARWPASPQTWAPSPKK